MSEAVDGPGAHAYSQPHLSEDFLGTAIVSAPDRLKAAEDRLAQAIGRLEAVVSARPSASQDTSAVQAQLEALSAENEELRAVIGNTSQRLDGTIAKFKAKLEA